MYYELFCLVCVVLAFYIYTSLVIYDFGNIIVYKHSASLSKKVNKLQPPGSVSVLLLLKLVSSVSPVDSKLWWHLNVDSGTLNILTEEVATYIVLENYEMSLI